MTTRGTAGRAGAPVESERSREIRRLYPKLLRAAVLRLNKAGDWGDPIDVVQHAILALVRGQCPADVPVEAFLKQKVRNIVSNAARRRTRVPESLVEDPEALDGFLQDPPPDESLDERRVAEATFHALIAAANEADDAEVALMVEVYREGTTTRADVAAAIGLTAAQHDAARKRLDRLCKRLPDGVLAAVAEVFGINLRSRNGQ